MMPYWRGIDALKLCESNGLTRTSAWLRAVTARPSVLQSSAGEAEMADAALKYFVDYATPGTRGAERV